MCVDLCYNLLIMGACTHPGVGQGVPEPYGKWQALLVSIGKSNKTPHPLKMLDPLPWNLGILWFSLK